MKFRPLAGNSYLATLLSLNPPFDEFLVEWDEMRKKHYNGEITDEEFKDWKLCSLKNQDF